MQRDTSATRAHALYEPYHFGALLGMTRGWVWVRTPPRGEYVISTEARRVKRRAKRRNLPGYASDTLIPQYSLPVAMGRCPRGQRADGEVEILINYFPLSSRATAKDLIVRLQQSQCRETAEKSYLKGAHEISPLRSSGNMPSSLRSK